MFPWFRNTSSDHSECQNDKNHVPFFQKRIGPMWWREREFHSNIRTASIRITNFKIQISEDPPRPDVGPTTDSETEHVRSVSRGLTTQHTYPDSLWTLPQSLHRFQTNIRHEYTSETLLTDHEGVWDRNTCTSECHWIPLLRIRNIYLLGLSGTQSLDSYRIETWSGLGVNSNSSLVGVVTDRTTTRRSGPQISSSHWWVVWRSGHEPMVTTEVWQCIWPVGCHGTTTLVTEVWHSDRTKE